MQNELEKLEAEVLEAFQSRREEQRRQQVWLGLIPGEPVDGEMLEREQLDGPAA